MSYNFAADFMGQKVVAVELLAADVASELNDLGFGRVHGPNAGVAGCRDFERILPIQVLHLSFHLGLCVRIRRSYC